MKTYINELIKKYQEQMEKCKAKQKQITHTFYQKSYEEISEEIDEMVDTDYGVNDYHDRAKIHDYARTLAEYEQLEEQEYMYREIIQDLKKLL